MLSNIDKIRPDWTIVTKSWRTSTVDVIIANWNLTPWDTVVILETGEYAIFMWNNLYYNVFNCSILILYINQVMKISWMQEAVKKLYANSDSVEQAKVNLLRKMAEAAEKVRKMNIKFKLLENWDNSYLEFLDATMEELNNMLESNPNVVNFKFDHWTSELVITHNHTFDVKIQYDWREVQNRHWYELICKLPSTFDIKMPLTASRDPKSNLRNRIPHYSDSNSICFWNTSDTYRNALRDLEYLSAVDILLSLANTWDFANPFIWIDELFNQNCIAVKWYETIINHSNFKSYLIAKASTAGMNVKDTLRQNETSENNFFNILHSYITTNHGSANNSSDTPTATVTITPDSEIVFDDELDDTQNPPF